jgi:enolase
MLSDAVTSIERAGYIPGKEVALAVDVASSHFYSDGRYHINDQALDSSGMVKLLMDWLARYPIISVEDGLSEEDWDGWQAFYRAVRSQQIMVLGDDLLCTNPTRIRAAIDGQAANSLLLKVNQIGTLTEALKSYDIACHAGWKIVVSARSGETEDNWLADLAVGWAGDYIKIGSIMQSERLAKYNRLLEIEALGIFSSYPIETLKVSAECLEALIHSGIETINDLTSFLEQTWGGRAGTVGVLQELLACLDEIVAQLKTQGFWPESLKDKQ